MTIAGACSHGGVYSIADHKKVRLDFSSSVNPLGAPARAVRAIERQAGRLAPVYPDPECRDLKKSLSRYLDVDAAQIAVGNGAAEIIYWFAQAFAKKRVVIPAPTFCEYELASEKAGAEVTFVPLSSDFALDAEAVIKSAKGADAVFMCNPNNPTGLLATDAVRKVIEGVDPSTKILLDECFIELVDKPKANTLVNMVRDCENLVVLRSLTKSFGMAGLRLGYSVSSLALVQAMQARKTPWNVNGLAQAAGIAALADGSHVARARALVARERRFLHDRIKSKTEFVPLKSDANYFLIQLPEGSNSTEFRDRLLKKTGVLVRDCSTFTGMDGRHIRVAVKTHRENVALVQALEAMKLDG
ncbi:PLP-dependent enzyme, histidinol-phosphate/aromatic aminotransferase or cobyric acid decarboxylase [Candidatus Nitrososphaera evergladensis SR1]|jgi:threonine-phosphate decarboxylase|uniref:Aminotransferase n=1 Tax=Candidatus Nitrososphaera evergladensis SR1 TaxID=1459636 RepID=A0A075MVF3_9ARCH|nr:histidinol-phosphate transaminase [Candidatus Nitrososphaera evergladensis]AIF85148.1 PLP-dependent enzyme, histidinol-phosphate/aromatic aminotransferase or cobyric acid decarboxylase [Candidatus Nitrososphaera evergladensis SR1]